jgi:glycosyltransferase involved in cell wall biosynthesis
MIIVDDASMDETPDIIKSYQDKRIKYIRHKKNKTLPHALNTGFAMTTGEYLTWTSDDNYYSEDAIESMVALLQINRTIDFVYANYFIINENGEVLHSIRVGPTKNLKEGNCVGPCFLYHRKVYEVLGGYNPDQFLAEDYEYWIRVFKRFRMEKLDRFIYWHRLHPKSLTGQYAAEAKHCADSVRDHHFKFRAIMRSIWFYVAMGIRVPTRLLTIIVGRNRI